MTSPSFKSGPYLLAAFICERILEEKNGVKSAIRIVDRVRRTVVELKAPEKMEPFVFEAVLLIKLKSGKARGPYLLRIAMVKPSGERPDSVEQTLNFEGEDDRGLDLLVNLRISLEQTGIYWFEIYLKDRLLTRVPLRVIYERLVRGTHETSTSPESSQAGRRTVS